MILFLRFWTRKLIDVWYKTDDKPSFKYARQLISNEGVLVGGSSGSAFTAVVKYCEDHPELTEDDVIVAILPDSIRSYLTKFVDDEWLKKNNLWDDDVLARFHSSKLEASTTKYADVFGNATVKGNRVVSGLRKPLRSLMLSRY